MASINLIKFRASRRFGRRSLWFCFLGGALAGFAGPAIAAQADLGWWMLPMFMVGTIAFARASDARLEARIEELEQRLAGTSPGLAAR